MSDSIHTEQSPATLPGDSADFVRRLRAQVPVIRRREFEGDFTHAAELVVPRKVKPKREKKPKPIRDPNAPRRTRGPVLPTVEIQRPRCPKCGHLDLLRYRSERDRPDGSILSWCRCLRDSCGHRFRLLQV